MSSAYQDVDSGEGVRGWSKLTFWRAARPKPIAAERPRACCAQSSCCACCPKGVELVGEPPHPPDGCEEACCPAFWYDEPPPPVPILNWVFDPQNRLLNDNARCAVLGNIGVPYFDRHRKELMGVALGIIVVSMASTIFGTFGALSTDADALRLTAWASMAGEDADADGARWRLYVGLHVYVLERCARGGAACARSAHRWSAFEASSCDEAHGAGNATRYVPCRALGRCALAAIGERGGSWTPSGVFHYATSQQFGAFLGCSTLVFAMIGALTRIRWRQDTNFQKVLGVLPDSICLFTNLNGLAKWERACFGALVAEPNSERVTRELGLGFCAFVVMWVGMFGRIAVHWLTPVPGGGAGACACKPPPRRGLLRARPPALEMSAGAASDEAGPSSDSSPTRYQPEHESDFSSRGVDVAVDPLGRRPARTESDPPHHPVADGDEQKLAVELANPALEHLETAPATEEV